MYHNEMYVLHYKYTHNRWIHMQGQVLIPWIKYGMFPFHITLCLQDYVIKYKCTLPNV